MFEPTVFDYVTIDDEGTDENLELDKFLENRVGRMFDADDYNETVDRPTKIKRIKSKQQTATLFVPFTNSHPSLTLNQANETISLTQGHFFGTLRGRTVQESIAAYKQTKGDSRFK